MIKKILIGILVVTVLALVVGIVWFFFFTDDRDSEEAPKENGSLFGRLFPFNEGGENNVGSLQAPANRLSEVSQVVAYN